MKGFKRYKVIFANSKSAEDICLGKSKEELLNFMHPYKRRYVLTIEEIPYETTYRIGANDINIDNVRCRRLRQNSKI